MFIELHPSAKELRSLKSQTKKVKVGECVECCNELWMCHRYNFETENVFKCALCDFHRCDIPCRSVRCFSNERDEQKEVYFTNYK